MKVEKFTMFILFGMFAIFSMVMIFSCFNAYNEIQRQATENEKIRTALCYVANKVRAGDGADKVYFTHIGSINTIVIEEEYDNSIYKNYIYYYDGYLMESFLKEDITPEPNFGDKIIELDNFDAFVDKNGLIMIRVTDSKNNKHTMSVALRSGGDNYE